MTEEIVISKAWGFGAKYHSEMAEELVPDYVWEDDPDRILNGIVFGYAD
jgi:hypothetical protein